MAITYKTHLWNKTDGYLNMYNGVSRLRLKKLDNGQEVANLDADLPTADMEALDAAGIQAIVDGLILADEGVDTEEATREAFVAPPVNSAASTRMKGAKTVSKKGV